jgi:hypothetical protein
MNERILAMAKECGLCDEDGDFYGAKNSAHEKFAELIVQECIDAVYDDGQDAEYYQDRIKRRFGIES